MNIIRAGLGELDAVTPLFDAYRQFYEQPSNVDAARDYLRARLTNDEAVVFLATIEGQPAGFTLLYQTWTSVALQKLWILNDLYVHPDFRKHGVGEALLEQAGQFVGQGGDHLMRLRTAHDNATAQRLYERLGWVRDQRFYTYNLSV